MNRLYTDITRNYPVYDRHQFEMNSFFDENTKIIIDCRVVLSSQCLHRPQHRSTGSGDGGYYTALEHKFILRIQLLFVRHEDESLDIRF